MAVHKREEFGEKRTGPGKFCKGYCTSCTDCDIKSACSKNGMYLRRNCRSVAIGAIDSFATPESFTGSRFDRRHN